MNTRLPYLLPPNPTLGLCAPSGFLTEPGALEMAILYFSEHGWNVREGTHIRNRHEYFAGTDTERLEDFHELIRDPKVDAIMAARGGYGLTRLLPHLDYGAIATARKPIIGFSDVTALHLAVLAKTGLVTFAGPMAAPDFGHPHRSALHQDHFLPLLQNETHSSPLIRLPFTIHEGAAGLRLRQQIGNGLEGILWGGNLSLVAHLVGTPYLPQVEEGILFLEEVNEEPYIIERCLMQLYHAGVFNSVRAILWGQFNRCEPTHASAAPYTLEQVVDYLQHLVPIPLLQNLPFGHVRDKLTLPVGGRVRITLPDPAHYQLHFSQYGVTGALQKKSVTEQRGSDSP
ncbi:S66 peptidase family protein [Ferrovum myxofaciens]|uniref:LD-carboxypeptidase n=1 Tax=Ferrovum myxofaciens TaxID=416213 RepID=A0A9E6MY71_9PROT|nr:LD-carboxypeptidase [Ferrovum myxofaciens]MBU6995613.1 LD-carboxypeptidase [Ferrovum myxofaciens]QKE39603.1 MAG: LD-carboxypeptidase [Ferrovum myxofaciens]QWY74895.1 MAG: LD-carboxypeptidase [Ferrovum myxofaciens]QWY77643.1 MAG: LD-carboxypeptidase [Ferrovum myxofaciens]